MNSRERTAYHEAGHAVCAWALGLTVTEVAIRPGHDADGRPTLGVCVHGGAEDPFHEVTIALAGPVAEGLWLGARVDPSPSEARRVAGMARVAMAPVARLRATALAILVGHWPKVEALARRLVAEGTVKEPFRVVPRRVGGRFAKADSGRRPY